MPRKGNRQIPLRPGTEIGERTEDTARSTAPRVGSVERKRSGIKKDAAKRESPDSPRIGHGDRGAHGGRRDIHCAASSVGQAEEVRRKKDAAKRESPDSPQTGHGDRGAHGGHRQIHCAASWVGRAGEVRRKKDAAKRESPDSPRIGHGDRGAHGGRRDIHRAASWVGRAGEVRRSSVLPGHVIPIARGGPTRHDNCAA